MLRCRGTGNVDQHNESPLLLIASSDSNAGCSAKNYSQMPSIWLERVLASQLLAPQGCLELTPSPNITTRPALKTLLDIDEFDSLVKNASLICARRKVSW